MLPLNEENFLRETQQGIVLLDFYATWCMPCKIMARNLNKLEERIISNKIKFFKIDIDEQKKLADEWKAVHLPMIVVLKDGVEIGRFEGCKAESQTGRIVTEWINRSKGSF